MSDANGRYENLTSREYAAIHLCVPDSGTNWLDKMIASARRDKYVTAALNGAVSALDYKKPGNINNLDESDMRAIDISDAAIRVADDAMEGFEEDPRDRTVPVRQNSAGA